MRGPEKLLESENHWETRMGGWFRNERVVYRGQDLHTDLMDMSWMELYLYGITGRRFTEAQLKVLNAMWVCTSYPDPRIWPNRVVALAGTARSTGTLGISSGIAVSEATIYGGKAIIMATDFILNTRKRVESGSDLSDIINQELEKYRCVYGFGRPIIHTDERRPYLVKLLENVGMDQGPHFLLSIEIEKILLKKKDNIYMNYGGLIAALAADIGFTSRQFYLFISTMFIAGKLPCFIDSSEKHEGTFFPLRCSCVAYESDITRRSWSSYKIAKY